MTPLQELRHSTAHVLATAVLRLFPEAKLDIGPPTDSGFYYDFDLDHRFTPEDLATLEKEMRRIIAENQAFERSEVSREEARALFERLGQTYKVGRLADIPEGEPITLYRNGEFVDLCAGTHVERTSKIPAFKLLSIAGAYHRGDERNAQLQRIYGTAFPSQQALDDYLRQLEEAQKRDHRKLGRELKLFHIDEEVGQGLILWTPAGTILRQELQRFITEELNKQGYQQVCTPHIGKISLFKTSGHFPYYKESQFPPLPDPDELHRIAKEGESCAGMMARLEAVSAKFREELNARAGTEMIGADRVLPSEELLDGFLLKPMNCPFHIKLYAAEPRSYRDLPVRLAEFGTVYRWEQSGELGGMTRVRGFTQDDAHIFCTEEQLGLEIEGCISLVKTVFQTLKLESYRVRVGLRDPDSTKYTGNPEQWDKAEEACRRAAASLGVEFTEEPGEAAFYGPKIDFVVRDVIGREWQLGTVQVDYNLPARFDLHYIGPDNMKHRPVMIHRAPFGSLERFCGVMIEHFAGAFPVWLAPEQVRVLPISDGVNPYARLLVEKFREAGVRVGLDERSDKIGAKIRRAQLEKTPYMLVVGAKEQEAGTVAVRSRFKGDEGTVPWGQFLERVLLEIRERR